MAMLDSSPWQLLLRGLNCYEKDNLWSLQPFPHITASALFEAKNQAPSPGLTKDFWRKISIKELKGLAGDKQNYEIWEWVKQRIKLLKNASKICNQWPGLKLFVCSLLQSFCFCCYYFWPGRNSFLSPFHLDGLWCLFKCQLIIIVPLKKINK